ncbi:MAG: hypothetical protein JXR87_05920 [Candidatus Marinimicrobia bacterium]|nr:hypothetical protein [Candidatus Neomarinimicrobiota bacterium]
MKSRNISLFLILITVAQLCCKKQETTLYLRYPEDVSITIDVPEMELKKPNLLIFYALPNGNSTAWTMGKRLENGDDWHFDIQHISAQTRFLRQQVNDRNIIVAYLENDLKSWPSWRRKYPNSSVLIHNIVDSVAAQFPSKDLKIALNGHSGGGSFIFGYLNGIDKIPNLVERISFIDSNYGYKDSLCHDEKLIDWLQGSDNRYLTVYAYNDSIALYKGKSFVSATGGTWYRSKMMIKDLGRSFDFTVDDRDSLIWYNALENRIQIILKHNPDRGIYHTEQVELNGFIHSILSGTLREEKAYRYFGQRVYNDFIK